MALALRRLPLLGLGLLITACNAAPSPSAPAGESLPPFVSTTYPTAAPADCAYGGEIAQIKAPDRLTVEFSLCHANPAFLSKIALPNNAIQDSDWLTQFGPSHQLWAHANGTGPYMVAEGTPSESAQITLGRFDGYWGDPAIAAEVSFGWSPDAAARLAALRTGPVDGIDDPSPSDVGAIDLDSALQLQPREGLDTLYIGLPNDFAPFDSVAVRRALAQGIDRQRIVDLALPPGSSLAEYFAPCSIEFGCAGDLWYDLDRSAARAALASPGFPGPLTTHIYYPDAAGCGLPNPGPAAQELQTQLTDELGFTVDLRPLEASLFMEKLSAGLLDGLYLLEWCAEYPDITNFLDRHFNDPGIRQFGTVDPAITRPLTTADQAADRDAREAAYTAANNAIRDLVPVIPIAHAGSATAWKADVVGAAASSLDAESFATMDPGGRATLVWMQGGPPGSFYCADDDHANSVRLCANVFEQLYAFKRGTGAVTPALAESCDPNTALTVWTCHLRSGVRFHDGARLDANDVVLSFASQWDYDHPIHDGATGRFMGWTREFGRFLNAPAPTP